MLVGPSISIRPRRKSELDTLADVPIETRDRSRASSSLGLCTFARCGYATDFTWHRIPPGRRRPFSNLTYDMLMVPPRQLIQHIFHQLHFHNDLEQDQHTDRAYYGV